MANGDGMWAVKRAHVIIAFIIMIATITVSVVMAVGIKPLKKDVEEIRVNDKSQDDKIHKLETNDAVYDKQFEYIVKKLDEISERLPEK